MSSEITPDFLHSNNRYKSLRICFFGRIVPRGRQRLQNRRLKHPYKRIESRVRFYLK